jgi:hypothetical protein
MRFAHIASSARLFKNPEPPGSPDLEDTGHPRMDTLSCTSPQEHCAPIRITSALLYNTLLHVSSYFSAAIPFSVLEIVSNGRHTYYTEDRERATGYEDRYNSLSCTDQTRYQFVNCKIKNTG